MKLRLFIVTLFWLANFSAGFAQVTGKALLYGKSNHKGIKVKFIAKSLTAKTDSVFTQDDGSFSIILRNGNYQISYLFPDYIEAFYEGANAVSLKNENLKPMNLLSVEGYLGGVYDSLILKKGLIYVIKEDLFIKQNLIIEPGALIYVTSNKSISIQGYLKANGTKQDSIYILPYDILNNFTSITKWKGFKLSSTQEKNSLSFCKISYARSLFLGSFDSSNVEITTSILENIDSLCFINTASVKESDLKNIKSGLLTKNATLSCCRVILPDKPYSTVGDAPGVNLIFIINTRSGIIADNYIDMNRQSWTLNNSFDAFIFRDENEPATTMSITNNYIMNYKKTSLIYAGNYGNIVEFKNNTCIGDSLYFNSYYFRDFSEKLRISNNIFETVIVFNFLISDIITTSESVFSYNLFSKTIYKSELFLGLKEKIDVNINNDSIDTYFNLFQLPRFLNNKPPYLSRFSPAVNAGLNADQKPVNMGYNPSGTCLEDFFTKEIEIISADTLSISGKVHQGTGFLNDGVIHAISITSGKTRISKVLTDGRFNIDSLEAGQYILYAVPNPGTVKNYAPTYYLNKLNQRNAFVLNLRGYLSDVDLRLSPITTSESGTSKIQGRFSYADNNTDNKTDFAKNWFASNTSAISPLSISGQPCKNMPVNLYNSSNQIMKSAVTDTAGYFVFDNLSGGNYALLGQRYGYTTENEGKIQVASGSDQTSGFRMVSVLTGLREDLEGQVEDKMTIHAFPNPFRESIELTGVTGEVTVSDMTGKAIFQNNTPESIDTREWPDGIYFLKTGNQVQKIIKQ